jgi:hypothetical protein
MGVNRFESAARETSNVRTANALFFSTRRQSGSRINRFQPVCRRPSTTPSRVFVLKIPSAALSSWLVSLIRWEMVRERVVWVESVVWWTRTSDGFWILRRFLGRRDCRWTYWLGQRITDAESAYRGSSSESSTRNTTHPYGTETDGAASGPQASKA